MTRAEPSTIAEAVRALARHHRQFRPVIAAAGPCRLASSRRGTHFAALAETIAYQQLNGRAAATIWRRVTVALGGVVTPESVLATPEPKLRAAGLSAAKTAALVDLGTKACFGTLPLRTIGRYDDEAVIAALTQVRGIGRWSAEMFLMFRLGRLDVWPVGDYGVRTGYAAVHGRATAPTARELAGLGDAYRGYRSVAAWYCWRALEMR
jgi:3-methyladenine DNA glycosylase/8-oxoguanine DNA glycosylase